MVAVDVLSIDMRLVHLQNSGTTVARDFSCDVLICDWDRL